MTRVGPYIATAIAHKKLLHPGSFLGFSVLQHMIPVGNPLHLYVGEQNRLWALLTAVRMPQGSEVSDLCLSPI